MTLVQAKASLAAARPEDSAALRRRLLQDLERQWLEAWGHTDQAQAQLRPASAPGAPASTAAAVRVGSTAVQSPASADASCAQPSRQTQPEEGAALDPRASSGPSQHRQGRVPGMKGAADEQLSRRALAPFAAAPQDSADRMSVGKAASPSATVANGGSHPGEVGDATAAGAVASAAGHKTDCPSVTRGTVWQPAVANPSGMPPVSAALVRHASLPVGVAASGTVPSQAAPADEQSVAAGARRASPAPAARWEAGSRQLMLRELNEQEVLASLRDAQLTASESAWAAQSLARALMQAGYARVQVVVNGQQHQQEAAAGGGTPNAGAEAPHAAAFSHPAPTSGGWHGH